MRFSDMMGSGAERRPEPPAPSDVDDVVASALAPYGDSDAGAAGEPEAPRADVAPPAATAPPAPPVGRSWPAERVVPDEEAATIADFTPLSDDLLPHRR